MNRKKVLLIGAGLGGLSAAISLRQAGYDVEIFEKNDKIGGKLNVLKSQGYTFDLGPSIFTLPQYFESLFARAGRRMADYVSISPVTPHWRNFFEDGTRFDLLKDRAAQHAEFAKLPGDAAVGLPLVLAPPQPPAPGRRRSSRPRRPRPAGRVARCASRTRRCDVPTSARKATGRCATSTTPACCNRCAA